MSNKNKAPKKFEFSTQKLLAMGAVAITGITGFAANSMRDTDAHEERTAITHSPKPEAIEQSRKITPEIAKRVEQSALQMVRRVKDGSEPWTIVGSANVVTQGGENFVLASSHQIDPFRQYPSGQSGAEVISSGYDFGFIKPGTDPNAGATIDIASAIADSNDARYDIALFRINPETASDEFKSIKGLRVTNKVPQYDEEVVTFSGNEASNYKPAIHIGKVFNTGMDINGRHLDVISSTDDSYGIGSSGNVGSTASGALVVMSSRLNHQESGQYFAECTVVTNKVLEPFIAALT